MELQELKDRWETLDKKIERSISLNRAVLETQLSNKAQSYYQRLFRTNFTLLVLFFVSLIVFLPIIRDFTYLNCLILQLYCLC